MSGSYAMNTNVANFNLSTAPAATQSSGISIASVNGGVLNTNCYSTTVPIGGSNTRQMAATGIKENTTEDGISLYPNPANSFIELQIDNAGKDLAVSLQNSLGQHICQLNVSGNSGEKQQINLDALHLANGIYFIKVSNQGKISTQKLIIQKD